MASQIDFAIAVGLFFTFIALLLVYTINYISSYTGIASTSELRTVAYNIYKVLFGSKGIPTDWQYRGYVPVKVGLVTDLYRMPVRISEANSTSRDNVTINISASMDSGCRNMSWNSSVRVYDTKNTQLAFQMYNQSFCPGAGRYLNSTDMVVNLTLAALQTKYIFIYFSPDQSIDDASYGLAYPSTAISLDNITAQVMPEEKLTMISPEKMDALYNLSYDDVLRTVGRDYKFRIEIGDV